MIIHNRKGDEYVMMLGITSYNQARGYIVMPKLRKYSLDIRALAVKVYP